MQEVETSLPVTDIRGVPKVSRCDVPVLIQGETGTGKEMAARAVHYLGDRCGGPFIPVNCGAIPDNLIENELFGHDKGAFTDAKEYRPGLLEQACGGTLFLDEVSTLSPRSQIVSLRFLQDNEYRPLGCGWAAKADVRIIAASNTDLRSLVRGGTFRKDLLFRIDILPITLPQNLLLICNPCFGKA